MDSGVSRIDLLRSEPSGRATCGRLKHVTVAIGPSSAMLYSSVTYHTFQGRVRVRPSARPASHQFAGSQITTHISRHFEVEVSWTWTWTWTLTFSEEDGIARVLALQR